jgi:hypothetical protein
VSPDVAPTAPPLAEKWANLKGLNWTRLTAGGTPATPITASISPASKLETPIERA